MSSSANVIALPLPTLSTWHGRPTATLGNAVIILSRDHAWQGVLSWDPWAGRVRAMKPPPRHALDGGGADPEEKSFWTDTLTDRAVCWVERMHDIAFSRDTMARAIELAAGRNEHHPIREYLDSLVWDKKKRLDTWLVKHARATDSPYVRAIGSMWMISCVARIYEPGCQVDYVLIVEGKQRGGKSSLFRALCRDEEWFLSTTVELGTKDAYQVIRAKWIVELAELDCLSRGDFTRTKAFITSRVDTYRKSYGREVIDVHRGCIFGGTVNDTEYLKDDSGGGRWWPFWCPATQADRLNTDALVAARDQLWAEAVHRYKKGEKWHPEDPTLIAAMQVEQEARRQADPWEETIGQLLRSKRAMRDGVSVSQVLAGIGIDAARATRAESMRAARSLGLLGWEVSARSSTVAKGKQVKIYRPKVGKVD